jgi:hypothetical protein
MGFNKRRMESEHAAAAKEAAARRALGPQILEDAVRLVETWNARQEARMPMLFSPTISARHWFLWVRCPACRTTRNRSTCFGTFSFLAAAMAAHLWFRASRIKFPPHTDDPWKGKGPFADALAKQSNMNARAAFAACIAAFFQALSLVAKIIGPLIGLT